MQSEVRGQQARGEDLALFLGKGFFFLGGGVHGVGTGLVAGGKRARTPPGSCWFGLGLGHQALIGAQPNNSKISSQRP